MACTGNYSPSPHHLNSTVCFTWINGPHQLDASEKEIVVDDSMSLTVSDAEECACSGEEPETPSLT